MDDLEIPAFLRREYVPTPPMTASRRSRPKKIPYPKDGNKCVRMRAKLAPGTRTSSAAAPSGCGKGSVKQIAGRELTRPANPRSHTTVESLKGQWLDSSIG